MMVNGGLTWWSSGKGFMLPTQEVWVWSLVRELKPLSDWVYLPRVHWLKWKIESIPFSWPKHCIPKKGCSVSLLKRNPLFFSLLTSVQFGSVQSLSCLRPHGLQHARPPCPSLAPRPCSNSCPLSRWCHPTISSSLVRFSSHLQSFLASGSFPVSHFFTQVAKVLEFQLQHQSSQWIFRADFL